jgi:glutaminase
VLATAGLYERTGEWLYETGLPAKSGVSGGLASVALGVGGLAAFSPLVDASGTSVRGQLAIKRIGAELGLGIFADAGMPASSSRARV